MGLLLALKALGNKEIIRLVRLVEDYKEKTDCTIYTQVDDTGVYVYDTKNAEFLLHIKINVTVLDSNASEHIYNYVV